MKTFIEILSEYTKEKKYNEYNVDTKKSWIKQFEEYKKRNPNMLKVWNLGDELTLLRNNFKGVLIGYDEDEPNPFIVFSGGIVYFFTRSDLSNANLKTKTRTRDSLYKILMNPK